jgi:hypothetical protein
MEPYPLFPVIHIHTQTHLLSGCSQAGPDDSPPQHTTGGLLCRACQGHFSQRNGWEHRGRGSQMQVLRQALPVGGRPQEYKSVNTIHNSPITHTPKSPTYLLHTHRLHTHQQPSCIIGTAVRCDVSIRCSTHARVAHSLEQRNINLPSKNQPYCSHWAIC